MRSLFIVSLAAAVASFWPTAAVGARIGALDDLGAKINKNNANSNGVSPMDIEKLRQHISNADFLSALAKVAQEVAAAHNNKAGSAVPPPLSFDSSRASFGAANTASKQDFWDICNQVHSLGFGCEHHTSTTEDGFQIDIVRVPPQPLDRQDAALVAAYGQGHGYPLILQHGLIDSASCWVANYFASQNLGTMLSAAGYDVYMPNARGNHYSQGNTMYPQSSDEYWQRIDMDFMAKYDMPANIQFVLNFTNRSTLSYVGHSQGGMMGFGAFSTWRPDLAPKVDYFFALAPACFVHQTTALVVRLLASLNAAQWLQFFGAKSFLDNSVMEWVMSQICPLIGVACALVLDVLCGPSHQVNTTQMATITRYTPAGTSVSNMVHWSQAVMTDAWATHDFGSSLNQKYWGQPTNPQYTPNAMKGPKTVVFYGDADALADPADVENLLARVPADVVVAVHKLSGYAHLDFTWGLNAHDDIYPTILSYLGNMTVKAGPTK